jgi:hypothetical protein
LIVLTYRGAMPFEDEGPSHWEELSVADQLWLIAWELERREVSSRIVLAIRGGAEELELRCTTVEPDRASSPARVGPSHVNPMKKTPVC